MTGWVALECKPSLTKDLKIPPRLDPTRPNPIRINLSSTQLKFYMLGLNSGLVGLTSVPLPSKLICTFYVLIIFIT